MTIYHVLIIFLITFLNAGYTQEVESLPELNLNLGSENVSLSYNSTENCILEGSDDLEIWQELDLTSLNSSNTLTFTESKSTSRFFRLKKHFPIVNQNFLKSYGGTQEESHGHYILECDDGSYLQIGETGFLPSSAKILVIKVDSNGELIWKREIGNRGHNLGNSAIEANDAYIIVGALNKNSALIKLDKYNGNILLNKTYNIGGTDAFEHIAQTDNGFIVAGYNNAEDPDNTFFTYPRGSLCIINEQGVLSETLNINSHISQPYRIEKSGSDYFISGLSEDAQDYVLLKCSSTGAVDWSKTYGGSNLDHCFGLSVKNDSVFLTGHTLSGTENWDTYTIKTDLDGNILWERKIGNPRGFNAQYIHDEAWGIEATDDGGCIIIAGTGDEYNSYSANNNGNSSDQWEVYLIKLDALGNLEFQNTYKAEDYGLDGDMAGEDITLTKDGHVVIAVDNGYFSFLKVNPF